MFFRKRREIQTATEKASLERSMNGILDDLRARIAAAEKPEAVADKLLQLAEVESRIRAQFISGNMELFFACQPIPLLYTAPAPAVMVGFKASTSRPATELHRESKPFFDSVTDLAKQVAKRKAELLEDNLENLAMSDRFQDVLYKVPDAAAHFAAAFARKIRAEQGAAPRPTRKPHAGGAFKL